MAHQLPKLSELSQREVSLTRCVTLYIFGLVITRYHLLLYCYYLRLPGGTERVINTKSTTVVENIIEELCSVIGIEAPNEREEFSLYCIVEGETFTVPLAKEHYILDVTTELQRDGAIYYLIFCRSVW